jgi:hypothetical protein
MDYECVNCGTLSRNKVYCGKPCEVIVKAHQQVERWRTGVLQKSVSSRLSSAIRTAILQDQGGVCAICGLKPEWQGSPLTFILDHISGDSTDDRPENVRLVCPNCDTQLPTYKSKNRGNGRHYRRERYAQGQSY